MDCVMVYVLNFYSPAHCYWHPFIFFFANLYDIFTNQCLYCFTLMFIICSIVPNTSSTQFIFCILYSNFMSADKCKQDCMCFCCSSRITGGNINLSSVSVDHFVYNCSAELAFRSATLFLVTFACKLSWKNWCLLCYLSHLITPQMSKRGGTYVDCQGHQCCDLSLCASRYVNPLCLCGT